jgi:alkaline phosphatase
MEEMDMLMGRLTKTALLAVLAALLLLVGAMSAHAAQEAKYIFLFIGDGMGFPQVKAAEMYEAESKGKAMGEHKLAVNSFAAQGVTTTHAADRFITGSAAAVTAIACGTKTNVGVIGMDEKLQPVKSIAHLAKEKGMKVGIVSSVSIDHATPAGFYAHVPKRNMYHSIGMQMAESGFDYFGGGGLKDPLGKRRKKAGKEPLGNAFKSLKDAGYQIVTNETVFKSLRPGQKVVAYNEWLQDGHALPYSMDDREKDINLIEFTTKGIELLDNPDGFFMMVESGKIDWACHANDAAAAVNDMLEFDNAVKEAVKFAEKHPDETLIVVTGDHECGGLTLGFAGTKYSTSFDVLGGQQGSHKFFEALVADYRELFPNNRRFEDLHHSIEGFFGITMDELSPFERKEVEDAFWRSMGGDDRRNRSEGFYLLYGGYDPLTIKLTQIFNRKAGLGWTSFSHTGVPVPTMADGVGSELFNGYYDNTNIALKIMQVMGVEPKVHKVTKMAAH